MSLTKLSNQELAFWELLSKDLSDIVFCAKKSCLTIADFLYSKWSSRFKKCRYKVTSNDKKSILGEVF
jgi:hypothetical protein